ncbi:hypothetical protein N9C83_04395, partial [Opitutales bacterium]|nr:hypothetical protein [Opitutales bacterium]
MSKAQCSNKNHNLFLRGSKIWFKLVYRGVQVVTSTGLTPSTPTSWLEARKLRDYWIAGIRREGPDFVQTRNNSEPLAPRPVTFDDVFEIYRRVRDINYQTVRSNVATIKKILRYSKLDSDAPLEVLNSVVMYFRDNQSIKPNSINADIRFAKAVFAPRYRELYSSSGIELPDLTPFLNLTCLKSNKPEGLPPLHILKEIDRKSEELEGDLRKVWIMVRFGGMRNREMIELEATSLQHSGDQFYINPNWSKTSEERLIPLRQAHWEYLLQGANKTILRGCRTSRRNLVNRELSCWLRQFIPSEYNKTVYAVRKYCESLMVEAYGS